MANGYATRAAEEGIDSTRSSSGVGVIENDPNAIADLNSVLSAEDKLAQELGLGD